MVGLQPYLVVSALLFFIGAAGVVSRKNVFILLMSVELMLNGVNLSFIAFARFLRDFDGQVIVFLVIALAAAEAAIGLSILILLYRNKESLDTGDYDLLRR